MGEITRETRPQAQLNSGTPHPDLPVVYSFMTPCDLRDIDYNLPTRSPGTFSLAAIEDGKKSSVVCMFMRVGKWPGTLVNSDTGVIVLPGTKARQVGQIAQVRRNAFEIFGFVTVSP